MDTVRSPGRNIWPARAAVLVASVLAACTTAPGAAPSPDPAATDVDRTAAVVDPAPGVIRVQGCEPRSLLPADADRGCGMPVIEALYTPLVEEAGRTNTVPRWGVGSDDAVAASISSPDAVTWTIELKSDWRFHDGEPVRASHFVDAWNFAAHGANAQAMAFLFSPIEGFDRVNCPDPGCEPEASELTGLRAVDDLTIEVTLSSPDRFFPHRLGHVAFAPLPPAALEDPSAFTEAPVGNGPLRMDGAWRHNERISLVPHQEHRGTPARAAGIEVVLSDEPRAAWDALVRGALDVATSLPPGVRADARDRFGHVVIDSDQLDVLVVPSHRPELADPELAEALSRAIDRTAVIEEHLDGLARPAHGLVPPVVSDRTDRCGPTCRFTPQAAADLLAAASVPETGIEVWVDQDADHTGWVSGVLRQWRQILPLEQARLRRLGHAAWVNHLEDRRVGGLYPLGWTMDVASPMPYLQELHLPGGLFNFDGNVHREASAAVDAALRATTTARAAAAWRQAEALLIEDLHAIPLWVRQHEAYFAPDVVADVPLLPRGGVRLSRLEPRGDGGGG